MTFIGNKKAIAFLTKTIESGSFNHAYIFSGPESVGKCLLAKIFANAIILDKPLETDTNNSRQLPDLLLVTPEVVEKKNIVKQKNIPIEAIRNAQKDLSLYPYNGKYKVLIVNDAHQMNNAAQNALLKTLEEPNQTSIIILVTHAFDRILPTIKSRCQVINFSLVDDSEMVETLAKHATSVPSEIFQACAGRPGVALELAGNEQKQKEYQQTCTELDRIMHGCLNERLKIAEDLSKDVVQCIKKMRIWTWLLRKKALEQQAGQNALFQCIAQIEDSVTLLQQTNASGRLILENLFINL